MRCALSLAAVVLLCGCLDGPVREKYVCSDGWVTDSPKGCEGRDRVCPKTYCPDCVCANASACQRCPDCVCGGQATSEKTPDGSAKAGGSCESLGCPPGAQYVSSRSSGKYHACDCQYALKLSAKNRICYMSAQEAQAAGKEPCGLCAKGG